jgi:hypothetical protein
MATIDTTCHLYYQVSFGLHSLSLGSSVTLPPPSARALEILAISKDPTADSPLLSVSSLDYLSRLQPLRVFLSMTQRTPPLQLPSLQDRRPLPCPHPSQEAMPSLSHPVTGIVCISRTIAHLYARERGVCGDACEEIEGLL